MSVALTANYIEQLRAGNNTPNTILELELDSGNVKYGINGGFSDVTDIIKSVSSLQNKLDTQKNFTTRGQVTFTIVGRDNFKSLIEDEFLMNRRVNRYDGFVELTSFNDYVKTFTGKIVDWKRKGDTLSVVIADDTIKTKDKIPVANSTNTQSLIYMGVNPVDVMTDILDTQLSISGSLIDTATFESERDDWLSGWKMGRVVTNSTEAKNLLNELQVETNSFIIQDGQQISYKVMAPPTPSQTIPVLNDDDHLMGISCDSGYKTDFFNRIEVYYDYDESGTDKEANYETVEIITNADSITNWGEVRTKTIKSKWFRTYQWIQPTNATGTVIYHTSKANGVNAGKTGSVISYSNTANTLTWAAPDGSAGAAVKVDEDGDYQLFDTDINKYIRVRVTVANLPVSDQSDTIDITALNGATYAGALANKYLTRLVDPATSVSFSIDMNNINNQGNLMKVSDTLKLTTDEVFDKDRSGWVEEEVFVTSFRPDYNTSTIDMTVTQARFGVSGGKRRGFIAPNGFPDYPSATEAERQYAFIGATGTNIVGGTDDGYYII